MWAQFSLGPKTQKYFALRTIFFHAARGFFGRNNAAASAKAVADLHVKGSDPLFLLSWIHTQASSTWILVRINRALHSYVFFLSYN